MEKELFCCLCDREYNELNLPRLFPACGHTYCENCIKNLMSLNKQREIRIICPQDHIEMRFEDRDINHFPKNISLVKLMTAAHNLRKKPNVSVKDARQNPSKQEDDFQMHLPASQRNERAGQSRVSSTLSVKSKSVISEDTLNEQQICLIHQKALEIVCIQHRTLICSSCAIFGQHKGHDFKSVRDMEKDKMDKERGILELIDRKEAITTKEMSKERQQDEAKLMNLKKDLLLQEIKLKFSKLYDLVKFSERKTVQKLHKYFGMLEERLRSENNEVQKAIGAYKHWEEKAMREVDSFERGTNHLEEQIAYLGYDGIEIGLDTLEEGKEIIQHLEAELKHSNNLFDQTIEGVEMVVNEEVEKGLNDYANFREKKLSPQKSSGLLRKLSAPLPPSILSQQSIQSVPSLREFRQLLELDTVAEKPTSQPLILHIPAHPQQEILTDEMLLETSRSKTALNRTKSPTAINPSNNQTAQPLPTSPRHQKRPSQLDKIVMPEPPPMMPQERDNHPLHDSPPSPKTKSSLRSTFSSPRAKQFLMVSSPLGGLESPRKKLKIKLPQKYEKVLQAVLFDMTDTADFTGAELGNDAVLQILEAIRGKKIKCLKFIRNKLTDDILDHFWPFVSNVCTLNLSQNFFTDRAIESFIGNMSKVPQLKNLVLSQNKINARNTKARVDELKRFDITISL